MTFDTLAPHYRWLEAVLAGSLLQRARLAHLAALDNAQHILLAGEGPGRFLRALRARRPDVAITVLDVSPAMLRRARTVDPGPHTTFVQADLRERLPLISPPDAIVTACVLDCFDPASLARVVAHLSAAAAPNAHWLLTDFQIPSRGWRRARARGVHALMYGAFRIATRLEARRLTPPDPLLRDRGFALHSRRTFNAGLLHADHWSRTPALEKSVET